MTKREFIKALGLLTVSTLIRAQAAPTAPKAPKKPAPAVRFTKRVREATRKLNVRQGRWKMIIVHHSGIRDGNAKSYDRQHRQRGMENGLAYHFVIGNGIDSGDGQIEIGSRWLKQIKGGHVKSDEINEVAIGICLVGNFEVTKPTRNQILALRELVEYLRNDVVGTKVKFMGHKDAHPGHTVCPGRHFPLKQLRRIYAAAK